MRKIILAVMSIILLVVGVAVSGTLQHESSNREDAIQQFAPQGDLTQALTAPKSTKNLTGRVMYGITSSSACKFRGMTSVTVRNTPGNIPANVPLIRAVNKATPYLNISGCTGDLTVQ